MTDSPEILPPEGSGSLTEPRVTINQFIQLVNNNSILPSGSEFSQYEPADREWIKKRVEHEQEARHAFLNQLLANDHERAVGINADRRETTIHAQRWAAIILIIVILVGAGLLFLGHGFWAVALVAVVMVPPIAIGVVNVVRKKIQAAAKAAKGT
jgi:uncharacterized membrane protein